MRSQTFTLSPTTSPQTLPVSYSHGGPKFRPSIYGLKNKTDQTVLVQLLSTGEAQAMLDHPEDFGWFELPPNKEYDMTSVKYFDTLVYKSSGVATGTLVLSVLDFEALSSN